MLRNTFTNLKSDDGTTVKKVKITSVIEHSFVLTRNAKTKLYNYKEVDKSTINPNDGKRHKERGLIIAHDDLPYPSTTRLKEILTKNTGKNHANITTSIDYSKKLIGFCPMCLASVKAECKKLFGENW